MSREQAITEAQRLARKSGEYVYVVYDNCDPFPGYMAATEEEMDTWYLGYNAEFAVSPEGHIER